MIQLFRRDNRPLRRPVIAHIHVPKCAGSSVRKLLSDSFGPAHAHLYVDDTFFVYSEAELAACVSDPTIRAFSSHFVRSFPRSIAGRDMLYFSFLRNPIEQFISYVTYTRKVFHDVRDANLLNCLPPDLPSLSIRQAAHWILTREHHVNFRENYTTNFFARFPFLARYGDAKPESFYRKHRLDIAKRVLSGFFFIGITEHLDRSFALLQSLARQRQLDFPGGALTMENTSYERRDDLTWIHEDDEVGSLLLRSIREDRQLYAWALARFSRMRDRSTSQGNHESLSVARGQPGQQAIPVPDRLV